MMIGDITGFGQGFSNYVMSSDYDSDRLVAEFLSALEKGLDPNDAEVQAICFANVGISPDSLDSADLRRIEKTVSTRWNNRR